MTKPSTTIHVEWKVDRFDPEVHLEYAYSGLTYMTICNNTTSSKTWWPREQLIQILERSCNLTDENRAELDKFFAEVAIEMLQDA